MAQPAGFSAQDNCTDMGKPVFWATANLDPPWQLKIWLKQLLIAVMVKENVNQEVKMEDPKRNTGRTTTDTKNTTRGRRGSCGNMQKTQREFSKRSGYPLEQKAKNTWPNGWSQGLLY